MQINKFADAEDDFIARFNAYGIMCSNVARQYDERVSFEILKSYFLMCYVVAINKLANVTYHSEIVLAKLYAKEGKDFPGSLGYVNAVKQIFNENLEELNGAASSLNGSELKDLQKKYVENVYAAQKMYHSGHSLL